jgi:hypothetical protein
MLAWSVDSSGPLREILIGVARRADSEFDESIRASREKNARPCGCTIARSRCGWLKSAQVGAGLAAQLAGFPFRRQLVVGHWIVDFAPTKVRPLVEVDGPYHEGHASAYAARDIVRSGISDGHVVRVSEHDVPSA